MINLANIVILELTFVVISHVQLKLVTVVRLFIKNAGFDYLTIFLI